MRSGIVVLLIGVLTPLAAGVPKPLPKELIAAMQARMARGQEIYEYEKLAWLASDKLRASSPDLSQFDMWVEVPSGGRRFIFFGRFKNAKDPANRPEGF